MDEGYWLGDSVISGVIGFAYSSLTSAFNGTDPFADDEEMHFPNFLDNAIRQGDIDPMFSHVLERDPAGNGFLALGGLPPLDFDPQFTSVPLQVVQFSPDDPIGASNFTYYTIDLDGVGVNSEMTTTYFSVIIDCEQLSLT